MKCNHANEIINKEPGAGLGSHPGEPGFFLEKEKKSVDHSGSVRIDINEPGRGSCTAGSRSLYGDEGRGGEGGGSGSRTPPNVSQNASLTGDHAVG